MRMVLYYSKSSPSSTFLRETRHLIGREDWLRSVLALLDETLPKKLVVLQGPVGVGKSSELHRLAEHLLRVQAGHLSRDDPGRGRNARVGDAIGITQCAHSVCPGSTQTKLPSSPSPAG